MYRCDTKENLDPAVLKVDEPKKICLTSQSFVYYYHL